jgi:hypothetical protein
MISRLAIKELPPSEPEAILTTSPDLERRHEYAIYQNNSNINVNVAS